MTTKISLLSAALFCMAATPLMAQDPIKVSCFRGPLEAVIWDRASAEFVESFVSYGYSRETAMTLADSICRNPALIATPKKTVAAVRKAMASTPKDG